VRGSVESLHCRRMPGFRGLLVARSVECTHSTTPKHLTCSRAGCSPEKCPAACRAGALARRTHPALPPLPLGHDPSVPARPPWVPLALDGADDCLRGTFRWRCWTANNAAFPRVGLRTTGGGATSDSERAVGLSRRTASRCTAFTRSTLRCTGRGDERSSRVIPNCWATFGEASRGIPNERRCCSPTMMRCTGFPRAGGCTSAGCTWALPAQTAWHSAGADTGVAAPFPSCQAAAWSNTVVTPGSDAQHARAGAAAAEPVRNRFGKRSHPLERRPVDGQRVTHFREPEGGSPPPH